MPETLTDAQAQPQEAVVYLDDAPHLELTAEELVYPISTVDETFKVYFRMRRYEPREIKPWYDVIMAKRKRRSRTESSVESPPSDDVIRFLSDHLLRIEGVRNNRSKTATLKRILLEDGSEPTVEQQKLWIRQNVNLAMRLFSDGIDHAEPKKRVLDTDEDGDTATLFLGRTEIAIESETILFSSQTDLDEAIKITHNMVRMSESDRHQYDKAISVIENARRGEVYFQMNWDVIELLYNRLVKSLSGALFEGQPCAAANKGDAKAGWIRLVPFVMKVYVMAQAFLEVELKNA